WLGPARERPFHTEWLRWHGWRDFATGQLGNWASHTMNLPFKALRIDSLWTPQDEGEKAAGGAGPAPKRTLRLRAEVSGIHRDSFPRWEIIRYEIPARGELPPLVLHWYNGPGQAPGPRESIEKLMHRPLDWGDAGERKWHDHAGCLLVGAKGMIHATGHNASFSLLPAKEFDGFEGPPRALPRSRGHEREWLDACRGGPAPMSSFDYAGPLAELVLLGNAATQVEGEIEYDPIAMKIPGREDAQRALAMSYREGWSL
ncbi:MAG: hypothetical protein JXA90_11830, partial [Planctomycetes bacterium]|nr:hypothetical protein [Planctomycetota bacterium]